MDKHHDLGFSWVFEAVFVDIKILSNFKELSERLKLSSILNLYFTDYN